MTDLREKDIQALKKLWEKLLKEQCKLRIKKSQDEAKEQKTSEHKRIRRDIARVLTVMQEKK